MNRPAASTSAIIVACPTTRAPPLVSSASVEMASKPRKDSTATDSALKMMLARNTLGSKKGRRLQCDPLTPRLTAIAPRTTKTASTIELHDQKDPARARGGLDPEHVDHRVERQKADHP